MSTRLVYACLASRIYAWLASRICHGCILSTLCWPFLSQMKLLCYWGTDFEAPGTWADIDQTFEACTSMLPPETFPSQLLIARTSLQTRHCMHLRVFRVGGWRGYDWHGRFEYRQESENFWLPLCSCMDHQSYEKRRWEEFFAYCCKAFSSPFLLKKWLPRNLVFSFNMCVY